MKVGISEVRKSLGRHLLPQKSTGTCNDYHNRELAALWVVVGGEIVARGCHNNWERTMDFYFSFDCLRTVVSVERGTIQGALSFCRTQISLYTYVL